MKTLHVHFPVFMHSSAIACSSSDNNSTYAGFAVNCQELFIQIRFKDERVWWVW